MHHSRAHYCFPFSVYELFAIIDALTSFEGWLRELQDHKRPLPLQFDVEYFAAAFEVMLEAEHHQVCACAWMGVCACVSGAILL